jgi:B-cell receptor-associated protein 31
VRPARNCVAALAHTGASVLLTSAHSASLALSWIWNIQTVQRVLITLFVFVAIMFVDTARSVSNYSSKHSDDTMVSATERQQLFRHQRNLYLTGITLFLLLVLNRFQALLNDLFAAEQKSSAVVSQAKGNASGLAAIVDERDALAKKCAALEQRVAELGSNEKATAALVKQAENAQAEYMRVLDENKKLLDQLTKKSPVAKKSD